MEGESAFLSKLRQGTTNLISGSGHDTRVPQWKGN